MLDTKVLLDAAALLVKIANEQSPTNATDRDSVERERIRQALERQMPHEWRDWTSGTLPSDAGDNTPVSPFYEKFKNFWSAMERERVPDSKGRPFNTILIRKEGGWKAFESEIKLVAKRPEGIAWFNHPDNKNYLPKPLDMLMLA